MRIVLSGPDGVGKSTIVENLAKACSQRAIVHLSWRRFGLFLARSVNLAARLTGMSHYESGEFGRIGYHQYRGIWTLAYLGLAYVDAIVLIGPRWLVRDRIRRRDINIADRFWFDIVADLALSTGDLRLVLRLFHPILRRHRASGACVFLQCETSVVLHRRPDIAQDRSWPAKRRIYETLRRLYRVPLVRTDRGSPAQTTGEVLKLCGL